MTNYITITKDESGNLWQSVQGDSGQSNDLIYRDFLDLGLVQGQSAEITFDTEKKTYTVRKSREIGWYLVECLDYDDDGIVFACHWNGENWVAVRNKNKWKKGVSWSPINKDKITVLSEKLPDNEHLRSLE